LECDDLEGFSELPDDMRPIPSQKPHKISKVTENSEEIRILYVKLLESLIFFQNDNSQLNVDKDDFRIFIQDIVNITRTLCMDPCSNIVLEICNFLRQLSIKFGKDLLFHFNSMLSRALFYPLTHKHSKLRLAAIDALQALMYCSPSKKNVEIMEQMIGFRDPNLVPIKDFYEPSTKLNYMALLISDSSFQVRKRFYECISTWLIELEDRFDHESRLIPYILSGLFDENEDICLYVFERLEMIGAQYEIDNEKDIREDRQFGIDAKWTIFCKKDAFYPFPLPKRPRLGSRLLIKKYLRRFIKNLTREFDSIEEGIRVRVSKLILFSIIYSEDSIVEYLDQILLCFEKEFVKLSSQTNIKGATLSSNEIIEPIIKSLKMLGRFCDYDSITNLIFPTILGELNANYPEIQRGALICLKHIINGHLESLANGFGFGIFQGRVKEIIILLNDKRFINGIDGRTAIEVINVNYINNYQFYDSFLENINQQREVIIDISCIIECLDDIFSQSINALGSLPIFDSNGFINKEV
jgi:hypothetical protein